MKKKSEERKMRGLMEGEEKRVEVGEAMDEREKRKRRFPKMISILSSVCTL